jgi:hexokinase
MVIKKNKLGESQDGSGMTIINTEAGQAAVVSKIPIITDKLINIIAKEENIPVDQIPLRDEYQVSGKYLGRTLGLVVDQLRDEYKGHNLFSSVKNTVFPKSFVVSNILTAEINDDWTIVKKDFQTHKDFSEQEKRLLIIVASALRDRSAQIVANHLIALWKTCCPEKNKLKIASDGPIIQYMPGWKDKFIREIKYLTKRELEIEIRETPYQGEVRDFRGIFDVMSQAIEYFNRN